jgi:hypothetical protein
MALSADDYNRLASAAADALASKGTPLAETIDKMASDNEMGLEQIKRLCEASNNASFKALFDRSTPTDRQANFKVASAEDVIARRRERGGSEKTASVPFDVDHELRPLSKVGYAPTGGFFDASSGAFSKIADAPAPYVDPVETKMLEKRASQDAVVQKGEAERVRAHLEETSAAARYKYASAIEEIAAHFRRLGPDYAPAALETFEKNAMVVHGLPVMLTLGHIRDLLPYGKFAADEAGFHAKLASAEFHVLAQQPAFLTAKIASAHSERCKISRVENLLTAPGGIEEAVRQNHATPS